jgi:chemotaxis protein CheZ
MSQQNIALRDAHDYLERVIATLRLRVAADREKGPLIAVLDHISRYILVTRREIASLRETSARPGLLSGASDELEEVVGEAARATNEIMSAAEAIEQLVTDQPNAAAVIELVTLIYTACAFQDITGQRIAKVVSTLQGVEAKVIALATACGGEVELSALDEDELAVSDEASLLNGPQLSGRAQTQEDIDRLFAELN